jgi:hypothetical protein
MLELNRLKEEKKIKKELIEKYFDFSEPILIDSIKVDEKYKFVGLNYLYSDPRFIDRIKAIKEFRFFVQRKLNLLWEIAYLADSFVSTSISSGKKMCFPRILEDRNHLVSFSNLTPVKLIKEGPGIIDIKGLPSLNGQIFVFTGQNRGGKSVAKESIIHDIYLAQSGLPVFASSFSLNVKKVIGAVFMERGEGSTAELLLKKTKKIYWNYLKGTKRTMFFWS